MNKTVLVKAAGREMGQHSFTMKQSLLIVSGKNACCQEAHANAIHAPCFTAAAHMTLLRKRPACLLPPSVFKYVKPRSLLCKWPWQLDRLEDLKTVLPCFAFPCPVFSVRMLCRHCKYPEFLASLLSFSRSWQQLLSLRRQWGLLIS